MGLLSDLESGTAGVRCHLGRRGTTVSESAAQGCVEDSESAVLWTCDRSPWRTDLGVETLQLLRFDVQRHARGMFEEMFERSDDMSKPRTSDPDWSPLIEAQTQTFGGRVLRLVHRTHYDSTTEVIEGRIVVPTSRGTVSISAVASADEVGVREKAVLARHRAAHGSVHPAARSSQAIADDVQWDDEFPEHPLSRVRAALTWLTSPKGGALEVVHADGEGYVEALELREASSNVRAPARFLRVPVGAVPVPPTMAVLSRVVFAADERPRTAEVWRVEAERVTTDFDASLQRVADAVTSKWARDGVSAIETKTMSANSTPTRAELIRYLQFQDAQGRAHSMQCWFTDTDGTVFRISSTGPRYAPANDLWDDMASITRSWKRIPEEGAPVAALEPSPKKRWWRFW